jgi:hypothetical protein
MGRIMRRFRQTLLATAFFIGVAAPLAAWSAEPAAPAAEQAAPSAPAEQSTQQRTSGSVTGTVSAPSASEFTLNYNGGSVKVLTSGVAATEKSVLTEGSRVTVTGTLDQTQRAVIAQKVAAADPNTPTSGVAKAAASADTATPSAPTADTAAAEPSDSESTVAEAESTTESEVAANEAASSEDAESAAVANAPAAAPAAPRQQMAAADAERLNLTPAANLPQEVVAEISDGEYTTADLNRAALAAMRSAASAAG